MCYDNIDLASPEFFRQSSHIARKQHQCGECSATIQPGERYSVVVGKWDWDASVIKSCPTCVEIRAKMDVIGCTYSYGGLIDDAHEALSYHDDADPAALERLAELLGVQRVEEHEVQP